MKRILHLSTMVLCSFFLALFGSAQCQSGKVSTSQANMAEESKISLEICKTKNLLDTRTTKNQDNSYTSALQNGNGLLPTESNSHNHSFDAAKNQRHKNTCTCCGRKGCWCCGLRFSDDPEVYETSFSGIHPNPVRSQATIAFTLTEASNVLLYIYDMNGRLVDELANRQMPQGLNEIEWNSAQVEAGLYLLQFQTKEFSKMEKLVVTK
jgi:hypothetical protein